MLKIIEYGSGNVRAFKNVYRTLNVPSEVVTKPSQLEGATKIVLPGVGAFDQTMELLQQSGFVDCLNQKVQIEKIPILGVCVGLQVMAKSSEEGKLPGLGWFDGRVVKLDESMLLAKPRLPHMGWNSVEEVKKGRLTEGIDFDEGFYFLHSYRMMCRDPSDVLLSVTYGETIPAALQRENIWGFQFHPEKSHSNGAKVLQNFAEYRKC